MGGAGAGYADFVAAVDEEGEHGEEEEEPFEEEVGATVDAFWGAASAHGDPMRTALADMAERERQLKRERAAVARQLRAAEKRRTRLLSKAAANLSQADLLALAGIKASAQEKAKQSKAKKASASSPKAASGASPKARSAPTRLHGRCVGRVTVWVQGGCPRACSLSRAPPYACVRVRVCASLALRCERAFLRACLHACVLACACVRLCACLCVCVCVCVCVYAVAERRLRTGGAWRLNHSRAECRPEGRAEGA